MTARLRRFSPDGDFCFGRDPLCSAVLNLAFERGSVLLFGGRQAGKTTVLRRIATLVGGVEGTTDELVDLDIPVYVDLLQLRYDARPADFFRLLAARARAACDAQVRGFQLADFPSMRAPDNGSLDLFIEDMQAVFKAGREANLRLIFLLDEAKRVLGDRFSRGFQDNLFSLLYGVESQIGGRIAIVFAGRQDLYEFCEDQTSPIGSRAATQLIPNLTLTDTADILRSVLPCQPSGSLQAIAEWVQEETGGQAGLTMRLVERCIASDPEQLLTAHRHAVAAQVSEQSLALMRLWALSLSREARCVHDALASTERLTRADIAACLRAAGADPIATDRVCEELQFTGLVRAEKDIVVRVNSMYWRVMGTLIEGDGGALEALKGVTGRVSKLEKDVWERIAELELALRGFVRRTFEAEWPGMAIERMKRILGGRWAKLEEIQQKSSKYYRHSPDRVERDVMECMYLGQIGDLMLSNEAWGLFRHMFRDKREFQDLLAAVTPVRNDRAHFAQVPPKELERCRIACDDLLVIVEKQDSAP